MSLRKGFQFSCLERIIQSPISIRLKVQNVRLGGMTDTYTYMAKGVTELEYPIPNPEPIAKLLHGLREDERLKILYRQRQSKHNC